MGERYVSLLPVTDVARLPKRLPVYGRNGVEAGAVSEGEREMGLLILATSDDEEVAKTLLTLWKGLFLHFGYPGRRATAGNLAFPLSPSQLTFKDGSGAFTSLIIAGTRDPFFQSHFESIKTEIAGRVRIEYPELESKGRVTTLIADAEAPLLFLQTIGATREEALAQHDRELKNLRRFVDPGRRSLLRIYAGEYFVWGMYHLFTDPDAIKQAMFPISLYTCSNGTWTPERKIKTVYSPVGTAEGRSDVKPESINAIAGSSHPGGSQSKPLIDMARVIRSKNAGVNKLTYDIFFNTMQDYEAALRSGIFADRQIARILGIRRKEIIGTYKIDDCYAVKISVHRKLLSGSRDDRDVYGAQQHMKLMRLQVPL